MLAILGAIGLMRADALSLPGGTRGGVRKTSDIGMKILRYQAGASVGATNTALDSLIASTSSGGVFVLSYTTADSLFNSVFERAISKFEASRVCGGAALACAQLVSGDGAQQDELCKRRGIDAFPTIQIWQRGELAATVSAFDLEPTLVSLGLRSADRSSWKDAAKGANNGGAGLPSATAVDDIDFTGGAGEGGRPLDMGKRGDRGTTQDYFPFGQTDKPSDQIGDAK